MKEKQRYHIGIGVPSILMIFVVLCLTTFGVLSYSSASADQRLTEKNVAYTKSYYEADSRAQEILQEIDNILYEAELATLDEEIYRDNAVSLLNALELGLTVSETEEGIRASYQVPVNEGTYLSVVVVIYSREYQGRYYIEKYCLETEALPAAGGIIIEEEENIGLWQG